MPEQIPNQLPVTTRPTPDVDSLLMWERVDSIANAAKPDYGTPHPDTATYGGYLLCKEERVDFKTVQRWYASEQVAQNPWNYGISYDGDSASHPAVRRRYILRRDKAPPAVAASTRLAAFTGLWHIKVTVAGTLYAAVPTVTISGGGGSGATARAVINATGGVAWIIITAEGSGYTSAPTVTIAASDGGGTLATATAYIQATATVLVDEEFKELPSDDPRASLFVIAERTYQTLPGAEVKEYFYDEVRGAVTRIVQLVSNAGGEAGSVTHSGGTVTRITYEDLSTAVLRKVTETWTVPGPTIITSRYEDESGLKITVAKTLKLRSAITEGYAISGSTDADKVLTTTEIERTGIASILGIEVVTTYPAATHYSSGTALVEVKLRPYQFPGRININREDNAHGHYSLDVHGTAIGYRRPSAELVEHVIKTWWVVSETRPVIAFDELNPNTITINDVRYENVLHDAATRLYPDIRVPILQESYITIPATQPSYSQYMGDGLVDGNGNMAWSGGWVGTRRLIDGSIEETQRYRWKVVTVGVVMK